MKHELTEAQCKAAGMTPKQADSAGSFVEAYKAFIGPPILDTEGNLQHNNQVVSPDGKIIKGKKKGAGKTEGQADNAKKKKTEYEKALAIVEAYKTMTDTEGWRVFYKHMACIVLKSKEAFKTIKPAELAFHQAMVECPSQLLAFINQSIENLNSLSKPGELPLWGDSPARGNYDEQSGRVEIAYPEKSEKKGEEK